MRDSPKNGAEIMDALDSMSQGWWRPSPGSVYPMLESMVKEGLIEEVAKKKYRLTESGRQETQWPLHLGKGEPRTVEGILARMSSYVSYLEDISNSQKSDIGANAANIKKLSSRLAKLGGR